MLDFSTDNLFRIVRSRGLEPLVCRIYLSTQDIIIASELTDSLDLDGLCILPVSSIRCLDRDFDKAAFYRAALMRIAPESGYRRILDQLSGDRLRDLQVLARIRETVAIHMELDDPDIAYIGSIHDVSEEELILDNISPAGERLRDRMPIPLEIVTKVEIATRYLNALSHAASVLQSGIFAASPAANDAD